MSAFRTILVVDDHDAGRFVKVQTLKRAGYKVIETATGTAALALVASEHPDLVMLDVNLPDISGLEVSRRLRLAEKGMPALQILQVSNTAVKPSDKVQGLEHGADVYLTEPVEATVLIATVEALMRVRRAEAALASALDNERRARQVAEDASRAKDDFIATLSHELRTPLNALMGWIWQLRHSTLSDEARERAFDSLERNARMQAQLINDLLDVSRISKGKLQLELRMVDLDEVVVAAVEATRDYGSQKRVSFDVDVKPAPVAGDPRRLQQVVTNLLTNAVQFTPPDGKVFISLGVEGDEAVLVVSDVGSGIDPALLPHIFDPFRQGDGVLSRRHGGLGLGLAVVRQLVDLHGGTIDVQSQGLGKGAAFTIRLPAEASFAHAGRKGRLLLEDVRAQVIAAEGDDAAPLEAMLESAGARVQNGDTAPDVELAVKQTSHSGPIAFRLTRSPDPSWHSVKSTEPAASVVREIARAFAQTRAS